MAIKFHMDIATASLIVTAATGLLTQLASQNPEWSAIAMAGVAAITSGFQRYEEEINP